jgi:hypothetical protein
MQATGSYSLGGGATTSLIDQLPNTSVDVLDFPSNGLNSAGLHSYGSTSGNFGSRSSGAGVYDVTGGFKIVETITNNGSTAANAAFNFYITPGYLTNTVLAPFALGEFVATGISFNLKVNGATLWSSSASLTSNANGTTFSSSGSDITSLFTGGGTNYVVNGANKSIDLGVLDVGQMLELSYELTTFAKGQSTPATGAVTVPETTVVVPAHWADPCGGDCSNLTLVFVPESIRTIGEFQTFDPINGSQGSSGDPFDVPLFPLANGAGVTLSPVIGTAVPEPSINALFALGLGALGFASRRRKVTPRAA